jgi:hypothetical protein
MSLSDPIPPPPPDDEFSRMVEGALNSDDFSLTENRRAAALKAFTDAAQEGGGQRRRAVHRVCWLAAGAAAAACVALWFSGAFSGSPATRRDEVSKDSQRTQTASGEQLAQTNLRLAVLSEQISLAEHQLIWLRATEGKRPPN